MEKFYTSDFKLGILGGGQLGRMFIQEAINYNVDIHIMDNTKEAPCFNIATSFTLGSLQSYDDVYNFGKDKDVLTIEIENVNVDALFDLEKKGVKVFPQPNVLQVIQDKGLQKQFYQSKEISSSDFVLVKNKEDLISKQISYPYVLKLRKGGYDGKGVMVIKNDDDLKNCFDSPCVVEDLVDIDKELSVIVARNTSNDIITYPTVECEFSATANLVEFLFSPADITADIEKKAKDLAIQIISELNMVGILAVEFFLTKSGELLINEVAPRPHNSGHQTIEGNITSQFEQHLRSVLNMPLGSTEIIYPSVMVNVLGEKDYSGRVVYEGMEEVISMSDVFVHLYGKQDTKPFRKMGHITILSKDINRAKDKALQVKNILKVIA